jgi:hypothetical protein
MTKQLELDKADETQESSWVDENGLNMSATGDKDTSGFHQLLTSVANFFKSGTTNLARFASDAIELGMNSASSVIKLCAGTFSITKASGYAVIKSDSQMLMMVPTGDTIAMTTYDSLGQPSDNGVGMIGYDVALKGHNVQTSSKTIPMDVFESILSPATATGSANFPADWTVGAFELLKRGNEVCCRIDATYKSATTLDYDLFTIPAGFRPAAEATAPGVWATGSVFPAFVKFESSGVVHVLSTGAGMRLTCIAKWMTA